MSKRFRAEVFVDVWEDTLEDAEERVEEILKGIPNSFAGGIARLPHGSKITFETKETS
tara:strand:- start:1979 stop:2152 length:174 start_codon:yes stop_codon:yes gene_type:complete